MSIKVSVIVPVYNVLSCLQRCFDSIMNQSLVDMEIIIVDDGSTDGSSKFVDEYSKRDARIRVIHKENGGLMSAWTTGVHYSHGEYIGFVDSDDYISPKMYELMYEIAVNNDTDIVVCNYSINHTLDGKLKTEIEEGLYTGEDLQTRIKEHVFSIPGTYSISLSRLNKLFRRQLVFDCLKYTESLSRTFEDRYFVPATLWCSKSVYFIDDILYYWILRNGSNHGLYKNNLLEDIKRCYYVQQKVVKEYAPYLETHWEISFCDWIKLYIIRNIINVNEFHTRYLSSKILLNDSLVKDRLHKYGRRMTSKMGKLLHFCQLFNSPLLLSIVCSFGKRFV